MSTEVRCISSTQVMIPLYSHLSWSSALDTMQWPDGFPLCYQQEKKKKELKP